MELPLNLKTRKEDFDIFLLQGKHREALTPEGKLSCCIPFYKPEVGCIFQVGSFNYLEDRRFLAYVKHLEGGNILLEKTLDSHSVYYDIFYQRYPKHGREEHMNLQPDEKVKSLDIFLIDENCQISKHRHLNSNYCSDKRENFLNKYFPLGSRPLFVPEEVETGSGNLVTFQKLYPFHGPTMIFIGEEYHVSPNFLYYNN